MRRSAGVERIVKRFQRWKQLSAMDRGNATANRTEEHALRHELFGEPSDWMLYRQLTSYVTTMPLLVPNNTQLSSLVSHHNQEVGGEGESGGGGAWARS